MTQDFSLEYFCQPQLVDVRCPEEANCLKEERWIYACSVGIGSKILYVLKMLGVENKGCLALILDDAELFYSDQLDACCVNLRQEFLTETGAKQVSKKVFCTKEQFIIPGYWLKRILDLLPEAQAAENTRKDQRQRSEMQQLLSYLV